MLKEFSNKRLIPRRTTAYMGELGQLCRRQGRRCGASSTKAGKQGAGGSKYTDEMSMPPTTLKAVTDKVSDMDNRKPQRLPAFHDEIIRHGPLRAPPTKAEELVDEDFWPLPCYSRMLFYTE